MALIDACDIAIGYGKNTIAENLNFQLNKGELTALLGRNGVGKSTLIRTLTGELAPVRGYVEVNGENVAGFSRRKLAKKIAIVTTERLQAGALKVREIVALGRQPYTGMFGKLNGEDEEIVLRSMTSTGIAAKANSYFSELSDGEKQKVMLARTIAQDTEIIVLDEPFSFLDVASRIEILTLLKRLAHEKGKGVLFSSHDVSQALRMSDRIALFTHDRKLKYGSSAEVIDNGMISELFKIESVEFSKEQFDFIEK